MIIGIDIGGTHADGVLIDGKRLVAKHKVGVGQLSECIIDLLRALLPADRSKLQRIHLSSTLCTNAIVTGEVARVGMFIQAGPGLNPDFLGRLGPTCFVDGAIDHRGHIIRQPNLQLVDEAAAAMVEAGIDSVAVVTKFSHRNNRHELQIAERLAGRFRHISVGHRISGLANFPRRVYSSWLNAALIARFTTFREAIEEGFRQLEVSCPCHIIKADGGAVPFAKACDFPCQSVHSGPSASIMGCLALAPVTTDAVVLDIGGTTTDIGLLVDGVPLLEPYGAKIGGQPTLIRALQTTSIGLGGDSRVRYDNNVFFIGPERQGPAMATGGTAPTPTDAMVTLGLLHIGSREKAEKAMLSLCPMASPIQTATLLLDSFVGQIREALAKTIEEVFSRPVYTVTALLSRRRITPDLLIAIGGPAAALQSFLGRGLALPCLVPEDYDVANAIGAARTRLTAQASLYADTADGLLSIPEISYQGPTPAGFSLADAEQRLTEAISTLAGSLGMADNPTIDLIERLEMNVVRGFKTSGKIIALKAQIRPGLARICGD